MYKRQDLHFAVAVRHLLLVEYIVQLLLQGVNLLALGLSFSPRELLAGVLGLAIR